MHGPGSMCLLGVLLSRCPTTESGLPPVDNYVLLGTLPGVTGKGLADGTGGLRFAAMQVYAGVVESTGVHLPGERES